MGNTVSNVFDGNLTTFYDGADSSGDWAGLDFGSGVSNVISQVAYCPRNGFAGRMTNGIFQAANNPAFSNTVTLLTITNLPIQGVLTAQPVSNTNAFRYVRYLGPTNANCDVAELRFTGWNAAMPPTATTPPRLGWQIGGGQIQFSWPADHIGWKLQTQFDTFGTGLTTNWVTVENSAFTNQMSVCLKPTNGIAFFRLTFP